MDRINAIIIKQLQVKPLESLRVQNHIYGCFVLMEDFVEKSIQLNKNTFTSNQYTFDLDQQFGEIGIRYGFLMDTKLIFDSYLPEYKTTWLDLFAEITKKTLDDVDHIEDGVIDIIRTNVDPDIAFFLHALQTGSLPQNWLHKVIQLLIGKTDVTKTEMTTTEVEQTESILTKASVEKPLKRFRTTKRQHSIIIKKPLGKTRRALKLHGLKV